MDLLEIRGRLDQIDTQIEKLFEERMRLCSEVAEYKANILTIHQSIPLNGVATLTLSVEVLSTTGNLSEMVAKIEEKEGVHYLKIVGRE